MYLYIYIYICIYTHKLNLLFIHFLDCTLRLQRLQRIYVLPSIFPVLFLLVFVFQTISFFSPENTFFFRCRCLLPSIFPKLFVFWVPANILFYIIFPGSVLCPPDFHFLFVVRFLRKKHEFSFFFLWVTSWKKTFFQVLTVGVCVWDKKGVRAGVYVGRTTGWRKPRGCLKLQVFFHKRAIDHRALFRKLTHKDKASYATSPPCTLVCSMCVCEVVGAWMRGGSKEK